MDDLELIKQKIDIVDLIQEYLPLKKAGLNFKAPCPFHQEKTPSFVVSPERQIWHCFGCDRGGDIFKFVMEKEGLEFKETLDFLATKAGITLSKKTSKKNPYDRLFEANQKANQYFQYILTSHKLGKKALEYLHSRGLTDQTIAEFGIGYAPNNWEALTKFLKKRGFLEKELVEAGLIVESKSGGYDRFRGRITFPLIDQRGKIIGFSGRILDIGEPKYINTPQTPIFDKKRFLFGLHLAKTSIREKNEAIIVEGEMDMIMSYQSGVKNIVASKGTALTEEQISSIKKLAENLSICFDTDLAGDAASRRGIEMAERALLNLKVIRVEGGKDPAEVSLKDPQSWAKMVADATPIYDYYLSSVTQRFNPNSSLGKKSIFRELLPIWKKIQDPMLREHYIQKLAALLQVKDDFIRSQIDKLPTEAKVITITSQPSSKQNVPSQDKNEQIDRRKLLEKYLIALCLHIPQDHTFVPNFPETLFTQEELKEIYVLLVLFLDQISFKGRSFKISEFVKDLPPELVEQVDKLYLMQVDSKLEDKKVWAKEVETVVAELKKLLIKQSLEKLSLQIKNAQEFDKMETLQILNKRFRDLSVKLKNM